MVLDTQNPILLQKSRTPMQATPVFFAALSMAYRQHNKAWRLAAPC